MFVYLGVPQTSLAGNLVIVIDDVGYNMSRGSRAIALPGPITIAVLPFAPHTPHLVEQAVIAGKDVIVHQPMQPQPSAHAREEHGTLRLEMAPHKFDALVSAALDAVPGRVGLSNHTGSLLTAHHLPMQRLMQQLSKRGLYFLDSRTTAQTVALTVAQQFGVPALKRDVFLDHVPTAHAIHQAFERALYVARQQGHAVLIGHPYPVSLDYLEARLRELPNDIKLVTASTLLQQKAQQNPPAISHPEVFAQPPGLTSLHISPGP